MFSQWDSLISLRRIFAFTNNGTIKRARSSRILSLFFWRREESSNIFISLKSCQNVVQLSLSKFYLNFLEVLGFAPGKKFFQRDLITSERRLESTRMQLSERTLKQVQGGSLFLRFFIAFFRAWIWFILLFISRCLWQKENRNKVNTMAKLERKQEFR